MRHGETEPRRCSGPFTFTGRIYDGSEEEGEGQESEGQKSESQTQGQTEVLTEI
jgi:hypothetical protein